MTSQQALPRYARFAVFVLCVCLLGYMIVVPVTTSLMDRGRELPTSHTPEELSLAEAIRIRVMEIFFGVMFFTVGATIGSFLNVVAYRLPRKESLISSPSRCPGCQTAILPRDNLPIFGWLLLKGECRSCHQPISSRYPLVELATGCIFLLLFLVELISGGRNLPIRSPNMFCGVIWILFYTKWDLVGIYSYHCALLSTLFAWSLIEYDEHEVPTTTLITSCICFVIPPIVWQKLHPVPGFGGREVESLWGSLGTMAAGAALGGVLGCILTNGLSFARIPDGQTQRNQNILIAGCVLVGIVLGWQGVLGTAAVLLLAWAAFRLGRFVPTKPISGFVLVLATAFHLSVWRWIWMIFERGSSQLQ